MHGICSNGRKIRSEIKIFARMAFMLASIIDIKVAKINISFLKVWDICLINSLFCYNYSIWLSLGPVLLAFFTFFSLACQALRHWSSWLEWNFLGPFNLGYRYIFGLNCVDSFCFLCKPCKQTQKAKNWSS